MSLPHRTSVSLTTPQYLYLMEEAQRLGINVADLIRRIIDLHRNEKK